MKQFEESHAEGSSRLVASTVAAAVVLAGVAGILAGRSYAAPPVHAHKGFGVPDHARVKPPKLKEGVLTVKGTRADDAIALRLRAGDSNTLEVDAADDGSADFSVRRADVSSIVVKGRHGNDRLRIDENNGVFTDTIPTTLDGGRGDDTLAGGSGAETMVGGRGNDSMDGNRGNDRALMGDGDDTFVWDPGDGSDTIEGEDGYDKMLFNGAGVVDTADMSANGNRLRFFRQPANITMDTAGVERVDFQALGGGDTITVGDLSGTDVREVSLDLGAADGQADRVIVKGTDGDDAIDVSGNAGEVKVSRLAATVKLLHAEATNDRLELETQPGLDAVGTGGLAAGTIKLFLNGTLVP